MAHLNQDTKELHLRILYVGAPGAGKTTNLQSIYKQTSTELSTRLFDLHDVSQKNRYFDFLPLAYGQKRALALRLHLFTLPAHDSWPTVLHNLMLGVDGIVFVVDSRLSRIHENETHLNRLRDLLRLTNRSFQDIPLLFQFNHRDAQDATPLHALRKQFSRQAADDFEAIAAQDKGVLESIDMLANRILDTMDTPHPLAQNHAFS